MVCGSAGRVRIRWGLGGMGCLGGGTGAPHGTGGRVASHPVSMFVPETVHVVSSAESAMDEVIVCPGSTCKPRVPPQLAVSAVRGAQLVVPGEGASPAGVQTRGLPQLVAGRGP